MRPLESGTWIFGTATLAALALAITSKNRETKTLLHDVAIATSVGAITMYLADLSDKRREAASAARPILVPIEMSIPPPRLPGASPPRGQPPAATPPSAPPAPATAPPSAPPAPAPTGPNAIGCTPLSSILPPTAVAQARELLTFDPAAADERHRPTLLTVSTMRRLAKDLSGCGSDLGFQPARDALVKDLEDTATRFENALRDIKTGAA